MKKRKNNFEEILDIDPKEFVGKTISKFEKRGVNCTYFEFTDGTNIELEVSCILPSLNVYGIVQVKERE